MGIENLLSNATEISFGVLFVSLFVWVMRKNDEREKRYTLQLEGKAKVIAEQQIFIAKQSEMMGNISNTVKETSETIKKVSEEIHDIKVKIDK